MISHQSLLRMVLLIAGVHGLLSCGGHSRALEVAEAQHDQAVSLLPDSSGGRPRYGYHPDEYSIAEGKLLYQMYNCTGCHGQLGGGGMGPALMDQYWRYGSNPAQIYWSIVAGRPNGMPSFRGRISDEQIWQLVSYVASLSDFAQSDSDAISDLSRIQEQAKVDSYGWIDQRAGVIRIPIARAMDLIAQRGLPTRGSGNQDSSGKTPEQMRQEKAVKPK